MRAAALSFLAAASVVMLLTFAGFGSEWIFALLAGAFPVALMALGAVRDGAPGTTHGAARWVLLAVLVLVLGSITGMMLLRGKVAAGPWWLGLPAAVVLQLVGLCLVPLAVTSFGFGLTFDRWGPSERDLARLRRRFPEPGRDGD